MVFFIIISVVFSLGFANHAAAKPKIVFDLDSGAILAGSDIDQKWYPASLTKIMTGYLAFIAITERRDISLKTKITLSKYAASQPPSKLGLGAGNSISLERALQALLVRSTNDIAVGIAETLAGSEAKFVRLMNRTAKSLGMTRTNFVNPHGLYNDAQVTTVRDLSKLSQAILLEFPQFARFYKMPYFKIGKRKLRNRNGLLRTFKGVDGLKTGFVCSSGYNLVATATGNGGKKIVAIMLGGASVKTRDAQVMALLNQGFTGVKTNQYLANATIYNARKHAYKPPFDMRPISCAPRKAKRKTKKKK